MNRISEHVAVVQQLDRDLLAIEIVRRGLVAQQGVIDSIPLIYDDGIPITKNEFKELGAAGIITGQVATEAIIGLVANSIETFSIRMKRHLAVDWEPFRLPVDDIAYASCPRRFRALNNVYKHQEGYIDSEESRSALYLVNQGYFPDKTYLKHLAPEAVIPNTELRIYEAFAHMYQVCSKASNLPSPFCLYQGQELVERLRQRVVYPIIRPAMATI